jgi:2-haloacid dehalogenase
MFVSSNGWDAAAGAGYGFHTAWVNRLGAPIDRLYAQPQHVLPDLSTLPEYV